MEQQTLTIKQVLEITTRNLEGINVPVSMIQQIGIPLMNSIGNLRQCINAIGEPIEPQEEVSEESEEEEEREN